MRSYNNNNLAMLGWWGLGTGVIIAMERRNLSTIDI